jgi:hypothetical protein
MDFVGFPFRISKQKNNTYTLNINFHIDLGRFIGDLSMYCSKIIIITF